MGVTKAWAMAPGVDVIPCVDRIRNISHAGGTCTFEELSPKGIASEVHPWVSQVAIVSAIDLCIVLDLVVEHRYENTTEDDDKTTANTRRETGEGHQGHTARGREYGDVARPAHVCHAKAGGDSGLDKVKAYQSPGKARPQNGG